MAKHSSSVLQKNARRGAITRQCPSCKRKAAMSAWASRVLETKTHYEIMSQRKCRYCRFLESKEVKSKK